MCPVIIKYIEYSNKAAEIRRKENKNSFKQRNILKIGLNGFFLIYNLFLKLF